MHKPLKKANILLSKSQNIFQVVLDLRIMHMSAEIGKSQNETLNNLVFAGDLVCTNSDSIWKTVSAILVEIC